MTAAELRVDASSGAATLTLQLAGQPVLRASHLVRLEVDRRRREALTGSTTTVSDDRVEVAGTVAGTTIEARWAAVRLAGRDAWELTLALTNRGPADLALARMDPLNAGLDGDDWGWLAFRSAWGDEFRPERGWADGDVFFESRSGRSSHGWAPWVGFERPGAAVVVAPAWSGNWHVDVAERRTVTAGISDWMFETTLRSGDTVTAPSVVIAVGADREHAAVELTSALGRSWIPRSAASDRLDVEWNHWWPYEDAEVDEGVIAANAELAVGAGIRQVTVDAGWFGPADPESYWSRVRGDWDLVNTARFPAGIAALGERIRAAGARPGIWLEGEAVGADAAVRRRRPGMLALAVDGRRPDRSYRVGSESLDPDDPTFLGYVCCGSEEGRRFVADSLDRIVGEMGAEWIKLDFNVDPDAGCSRTDHGHGSGDGLFRHYLGLYEVLDGFRERHPETVLEACASGGLRIDLGLARHVHCAFLSDPDYTEHALQVLWGTSLLLPPAAMLHWSWSQWRGDYPPAELDFARVSPDAFATTLRAALLHRTGVSLRLPELRDDLRDVLAAHVAFFTDTVAELVRDGVLRRLTDQPQRGGRGERAPAFQLSSDGGSRHLVAAFRLDGAGTPGVVRPLALEPAADYRVTEPLDDRPSFSATGAELQRRGIPEPEGDSGLDSRLVLIERI